MKNNAGCEKGKKSVKRSRRLLMWAMMRAVKRDGVEGAKRDRESRVASQPRRCGP